MERKGSRPAQQSGENCLPGATLRRTRVIENSMARPELTVVTDAMRGEDASDSASLTPAGGCRARRRCARQCQRACLCGPGRLRTEEGGELRIKDTGGANSQKREQQHGNESNEKASDDEQCAGSRAGGSSPGEVAGIEGIGRRGGRQIQKLEMLPRPLNR